MNWIPLSNHNQKWSAKYIVVSYPNNHILLQMNASYRLHSCYTELWIVFQTSYSE
jgi:hypothetical protein